MQAPSPDPPSPDPPRSDPSPAHPWWDRPGILAALVLLTAVPLLWPDIPPLVDLPGHMGRYKVQLDLADSPALQRFYGFEWALIGNLGVDLLVVPLSRLFGLELAVKLIVIAIPATTVAGFLLVAREVHGCVPPTALFALPLAYNYPFMFGFVNFALSMALCLLAFALWLRLTRLRRFGMRAALFVPISLILWVTHTFGWGVLGLLAASAELVRQERRGEGLVRAIRRTAVQCLALAPPLLLILFWRAGAVAGETGDWFNIVAKWRWFLIMLHDRWTAFDTVSLGALMIVVYAGARRPELGMKRDLGVPALMLALAFFVMPRIVFGSAFADMRLAPFVVAVAILAIAPPTSARLARIAALAGLSFLLVRTAGTTASFLLYDRAFDRELAALDALPRGARVAAFTHVDCAFEERPRLDHIPALAIVRREAFANDQWAMAGAQLLTVRHPQAGVFASDPSQLVTRNSCTAQRWTRIDDALRSVPRDAFDYIWLIAPPPYDAKLTRGLTPVWRHGSSVLFRIDPQDRE